MIQLLGESYGVHGFIGTLDRDESVATIWGVLCSRIK